MPDQQATERAAFLAPLGLTFAAVFVPQSASRHRDEKEKTLNWRVSIANERGTLACDYTQGIGFIPDRPQHLPRTLYYEKLQAEYDAASETGRYPHSPLREHKHEHGTRLDIVPHGLKPLPGPTLEEVLHSLVMDATAADMTFEEWAGEYGYDTDSRKAEKTYRECADLGLRLRRILGGTANVETLAALFQDF